MYNSLAQTSINVHKFCKTNDTYVLFFINKIERKLARGRPQVTHLRNLTLDRCAPSKWDLRLILTPSWKEVLSVRRLKRWLVG